MPPPQKPGKSEQDVVTPDEFIRAVLRLLQVEEFGIDLAADTDNTKAGGKFLSREDDALAGDWEAALNFYNGDNGDWCWLNPPYGYIKPWAKKCAEEGARGTKIALLVPAAVGSNWYRDYVENHAYAFFLNPRLKFVGHKTSYPKDLMLCLYGGAFRGQSVWRWQS